MAGEPSLDAARVSLRMLVHIRTLPGSPGHMDLHALGPKEFRRIGDGNLVERAHETRTSPHGSRCLAYLAARRAEVGMFDVHKDGGPIPHLPLYHPKRCGWQIGPALHPMARVEQLARRLPEENSSNGGLGEGASIPPSDPVPNRGLTHGRRGIEGLVNFQEFPGLEELRQPGSAERTHVSAEEIARVERNGRPSFPHALTAVGHRSAGPAAATGPPLGGSAPWRCRGSGLWGP